MAVQDLVKGELDWHEKINANMHSLQEEKLTKAEVTEEFRKEGGYVYQMPDGTTQLKAGGGGAGIMIDSELSETSENPVQNKVVTDKFNEVFQSVSDGKEKVAIAITERGINTDSNASFQTMADNILKIIDAGKKNVDLFVNGAVGVGGKCKENR